MLIIPWYCNGPIWFAKLRILILNSFNKTFLRMNWNNNLSKKLRNSYNAMKRLLRGINI
jgi:hypothetical protein